MKFSRPEQVRVRVADFSHTGTPGIDLCQQGSALERVIHYLSLQSHGNQSTSIARWQSFGRTDGLSFANLSPIRAPLVTIEQLSFRGGNMTSRRLSTALAGFAIITGAAAGCGTTADTPAIDSATSTTTSTTRSGPTDGPAITASAPAGVRGKGKVVGSAVLKVLGSGTATVTWKANGGPAHVERDVPLPWEHSIDVVEEAPSEVRADGAASGCTITMGDMLVSFKNEPNPVCEFAYWG